MTTEERARKVARSICSAVFCLSDSVMAEQELEDRITAAILHTVALFQFHQEQESESAKDIKARADNRTGEDIAKWFYGLASSDSSIQQSESALALVINETIASVANKREIEAVGELVEGLMPFARTINEELADDKSLYVSLDDVFLRVGPTVGHCRKAAALIAKHSRKV